MIIHCFGFLLASFFSNAHTNHTNIDLSEMECICAQCRKKHSYVCPNFEATGSCPQGSKCKLHHPKNRSKGKKIKRLMEHKNARGRYFGIDISEPKSTHQALDDDNIFSDGKFSNYICFDISDDEAERLHQESCDQTIFVDNDSSDLQLDDLDESIKPFRIMDEYKS